MVTQCGQPKSRVAGSGAMEAGGWRPRPAIPPSLPYEPGQEDAWSSRKRRNQTLPKTEREIPKKWDPIFPWNNTDTISKSGDIHKPTNRANPWEGDGWQATDEEARSKNQAPSLKQWSVQASRTGQPRTSTATTDPVEGGEEPRDQSPEAVASQGWAQAPHPPPSTRMTASSSQRRHGATARVRPAQGTQNIPFRDQEPAPPCPGIRSQKETEIDDPTFTLQPVANRNGTHRRRCVSLSGPGNPDRPHRL